MIPDSVIEEIKYRNDIEDVISSYLTLKRAGSNRNGLCPFHSEKTASFTVFPATKSFYCFGCGAGGDVISFIMRIENLDYPAALEFLAKRAGITLPESGKDINRGMKRSRVIEMNTAAAHFFHDSLKENENAQRYLKERGLHSKTISHFGIGYAPDGFGALTDYMRSLGYSEEELITGFLCGKSQKTGRAYDYFRGRIIFPIIDLSGSVIAFGGRIIGDGKPKYLNSSDTPAFSKRKNLYGLNFAKNHCSENLIICEGYMDVISMHAAGFENAVATLGTAITPDHARLIKKFTDKVILSYDSDAAGQAASDKAFSLLEAAGVEAKILRMEGAKDPDEYIKKYGSARFSALLNDSISQFDYILSNILKDKDLSNTDHVVAAAAEAAEKISGFSSSVERDLYISKAAAKLEISPDSLRRDTEKIFRRRTSREKREKRDVETRKQLGYGDRINPQRLTNLRAAAAEEMILGILLVFPEYAERIRQGKISLSPDDFVTDFYRRIYESLILHSADGNFDIGILNGEFTPDEISRITSLQLRRSEIKSNNDKALSDSIELLRGEKKKDGDTLESIIERKRKKQEERK